MEDAQSKRYIVHAFSLGSPVLIDRVENTMSFYRTNLYGQIYNLQNPERLVVGARVINGLIRRTQNPCYNSFSGKAVDGYIYEYLMTPEQQAKCRAEPSIFSWNELIVVTDDKNEAIKAACVFAFENTPTGKSVDKVADKERLLKYCDDFLEGKLEQSSQTTNITSPTVKHNIQDHGDR